MSAGGSTQTRTGNAVSRTAMMTSPHTTATQAGIKILEGGGNAIEAVVAAGAALSVLYPHFCGLGGDAVWLVADDMGNATTFLGIGQAPEQLGDIAAIDIRGPGSMLTTACLVDSWQSVLDYSNAHWSGSQPLAALLTDAIALAEGGFPVSASQSFWHRFRQSERTAWLGFDALFVGQGRQYQPQLARSLTSIARHGARDFYEGELSTRIAKGLADAGSPLTPADLARTRTRIEAPVSLAYRNVTLLAPPPPTQGLTTLGIMGILAHLKMSDFDSTGADFYHHLVESVKQAFLDRGGIADPDFSDLAFEDWLRPERLSAKARGIDSVRAMAWPHRYQPGDTAFLAATDAHGRSACVLQSIYFDWGSGVVVGDTGILWQNRGAAFSLDPASPNRIEASKRPFYTLNPGIALRDGRPHLLYGTQGADGQPQTLALLLSLLLDHGLDPLAALSRPRFLLGKTFSDSSDTLKVEANIAADVVGGLATMGHDISTIDAFSQLGGQAGIIRIGVDGSIDGAHDPRSDGCAIGL